MEIKELENKIVDAVKTDKSLLQRFLQDPIKTSESVLGVDLPDEQVKAAVKGALDTLGNLGERLGDMTEGLTDKAEGLFDKVKDLFTSKKG